MIAQLGTKEQRQKISGLIDIPFDVPEGFNIFSGQCVTNVAAFAHKKSINK